MYFFAIDGLSKDIDDQPLAMGLADDDAAWSEATTFAGELFRDADGKLKPGQQWRMEVMNEALEPIYLIDIKSRKLK